MADAFDQAWGVVKADLERQTNWQKLLPDFDEPRAEMARTAEAEMPNVDDDEDLNIDDNQGECCRNLSMKFEAIFSGTPYDNSEGFQLLSSKPNAMYVDWNWWDEPCDDAIAIFNSQIKPDLEAVIRDAYHDGGMDDDFAKLAEDMLEQALEAIQEYEACQRGGFEGVDFGGDFTASGDVFEDSWAVTKFQPGIKQAWERFESGDSMPSLIPGLSGNKSKRHYQKFLTDAFGRTGSEEMIEPNIGGGGGVFAVRPHVAYIGNDYNRFIPNFFRNVRDNPNLLEWKPSEEYTYRVGDPRTLPGLMPGSPIIDLPSVTAQEVRDFHDITGGAGLDSDQMYASNLRFFELRRKMNELMNEGKWRTNPDKSAEMARLTGILLPQMIGGHFRIGDEATHSLNIAPRGPSKQQKELVRTKYPDAYGRSQELLDLIHAGGGSKSLSLNTTLPYIPQRVDKRGRDVDVPYSYEPWSREMRDKEYHFHEGDHVPFLEAVAPYADPEYKSFLLSDPPYYQEPGEHKLIASDKGEPGGFTHRLMSAIRPIVDAGVPTIAFNSARMPRHLWDTGGLTGYQVLPRTEKGIQGKGREVMEVVGMANIPGMSQEKVNEMQTWPDSELPMRGFYRQTAFGQRD